jgi:hypothetical protein
MKQQGLAPIYIILIVLLILGGGLAFYFLVPELAPSGQGNEIPQPTNGDIAQLPPPEVVFSLTSPKTQYKVGDEIPISVIADTGSKETAGLDVMLLYDPTAFKLKIINQSAKIDQDRYIMKEGTQFENYNYFKSEENEGKLIFSALKAPQLVFSGKTTVGTLTFQALKAGVFEIKFNFQPGTSHDFTNISVNGEEILDGVENITITVN